MPPSQIEMLEKLINEKFEGLEKYLDEKFKTNDKAHESFDEHFKTLNGQTRRNTKFRWLASGLVTLVLIGLPLYLRYK